MKTYPIKKRMLDEPNCLSWLFVDFRWMDGRREIHTVIGFQKRLWWRRIMTFTWKSWFYLIVILLYHGYLQCPWRWNLSIILLTIRPTLSIPFRSMLSVHIWDCHFWNRFSICQGVLSIYHNSDMLTRDCIVNNTDSACYENEFHRVQLPFPLPITHSPINNTICSTSWAIF